MSVFVFLGPSLPIDEAREIIDATYLPPVAMGDLYTLVRSEARSGDIIAIIDGLFEQVPAVWHKEVLYALSKGIRVFGASSMGALRAAELHPFGMIGVGDIFEAYRTGTYEDDDEVVVVHAPADAGYRPVSEAMANMRAGLRMAAQAGHISPDTHLALVELGKSRFYAERTWDQLYADGHEAGIPTAEIDALQVFVGQEKPNAKSDDARALLRRLVQESTDGPRPATPDFLLQETTFWIGLTRAHAAPVKSRSREYADAISGRAVVEHARAIHPQRARLWRHALLLRLIANLGGSVAFTRDQVQATTLRFCRRHGIASHAMLDQWRIEQALSKEELAYLLELETRYDILVRKHRGDIEDFVLLELKRNGEFVETAKQVERKWSNLARLGITKPTLEDAGIDANELQRWYEERCGRMAGSPEKHIEEIGFESLRDFVSELLATYMLESG